MKIISTILSLFFVLPLYSDELPTNVDEAVRRLDSVVDDAMKAYLVYTTDGMHRSLGMWVRNNLGLWHDNKQLLKSTGEEHPENASGVIINSFRNMLLNRLSRTEKANLEKMKKVYSKIQSIKQESDIDFRGKSAKECMSYFNDIIHRNNISLSHNFTTLPESDINAYFLLHDFPFNRILDFYLRDTDCIIKYDYPNLVILRRGHIEQVGQHNGI